MSYDLQVKIWAATLLALAFGANLYYWWFEDRPRARQRKAGKRDR